MSDRQYSISQHDADILRALGRRKAEIAQAEDNLERKRLWYAHDAGHSERPMVLAEAWAIFEMLPEAQPKCQEPWAQDLERFLKFEIYQYEQVRDDHVIEPYVGYNWTFNISDYGVTSKQEYASRVSGNISSRHWDPPIKDMSRDLDLLRPRTFAVDREDTLARKAALESVFDGICPVRLRGHFWWTAGLTITAIDLIGLENMMVYMCTEPEALHRLMAFLQADRLAQADFMERERLLSLDNENDYIGSGSMGYTKALPQSDWRPGDPVRLKDVWVLVESQETVSVSPEQFNEFVIQYLEPIAARFGRCYYGCCEPVHDRWDHVKKLPNLKRVSVSPWCDQAIMAEALGRDYVFSRKPNPTLISTPDFDEDLIRADLRTTLETARNCNLEIIMKDVHSVCGHTERVGRWVELAYEMIARVHG